MWLEDQVQTDEIEKRWDEEKKAVEDLLLHLFDIAQEGDEDRFIDEWELCRAQETTRNALLKHLPSSFHFYKDKVLYDVSFCTALELFPYGEDIASPVIRGMPVIEGKILDSAKGIEISLFEALGGILPRNV